MLFPSTNLPPIRPKHQKSYQIHTLLLPKGCQDLLAHITLSSLLHLTFLLNLRYKPQSLSAKVPCFPLFTGLQGSLYEKLFKAQHYSQIEIFVINTLGIHYLAFSKIPVCSDFL